MFTAEKWRGFTRELEVNVAALTADATRAAMVETATAARARVLGGNPKPTGYRQIVDGVENAPLTAVRPDGVIIFAWQYLGAIAQDTYDALVNRAPHLTGRYAAGIQLLIDGVPGTPDDIGPDAKEVHIVASVPYARRLEVGKTKAGRSFVVQVPPHIVEETASVARRLWGTAATFQFTYVDLREAYELKTPAGWRRKYRVEAVGNGRRRVLSHVQKALRYPAIKITPRSA
jgi:hypothetical protein